MVARVFYTSIPPDYHCIIRQSKHIGGISAQYNPATKTYLNTQFSTTFSVHPASAH
eukprot:m.751148 g.751148  ORF g.751148 m.751148 type:complete len:56 (+) comp23164_c0_seq5:367-534(+)